HRLDAREDREPAAGEDADLASEPRDDHVRERSTAREERARPLDLEREQPLERGTDAARRERLAAPGKAIEVLVWNVHAAAGMVAGDVLPEVRQLERRADVVAPRLA